MKGLFQQMSSLPFFHNVIVSTMCVLSPYSSIFLQVKVKGSEDSYKAKLGKLIFSRLVCPHMVANSRDLMNRSG